MKRVLIILLCFGLLGLAACAVPPEEPLQSAQEEAAETPSEMPSEAQETVTSALPEIEPRPLETLSLESEAVAGNIAGTSSKTKLVVYLPPSYDDSDKRYPVVYYLHGYGENAGSYIRDNDKQLDQAFAAGADEFIFVEVTGKCSFYVNSPVTGNWEDYVISEAIPLVDETYRTLPNAESRGICGFSMGGFGAVNLALKHPDVFAAVYAMSPGLLAEDNGFEEAMESWDGGFLQDYGRAFAPDEKAELLGRVPAMDGSEADNDIIAQWKNGYGNLTEKLDAYIALEKPLKGIGLCYGEKDNYTWIPKGTEYFSKLLSEKGIDNSLYAFDGYHTQPPDGMAEIFVPFFNEYLVFE